MRTNQEMMQSVLCYIEEHLDGELTLDTIGAFTGYSPYHVHKLFTAICGMPLHAYIRRRQVSKGALLLVQSDLCLCAAGAAAASSEAGYKPYAYGYGNTALDRDTAGGLWCRYQTGLSCDW